MGERPQIKILYVKMEIFTFQKKKKKRFKIGQSGTDYSC